MQEFPPRCEPGPGSATEIGSGAEIVFEGGLAVGEQTGEAPAEATMEALGATQHHHEPGRPRTRHQV